MRYTRSQYRGYICALSRSRHRRSTRALCLFVLFAVLAGAYFFLHGNQFPGAERFDLQQASAESAPQHDSASQQETASRHPEDHKDKEKAKAEAKKSFRVSGPSNPAARDAWAQEFGSLLEKKTVTVSAGDTLINILLRAGVPGPDAYRAVNVLREVFNPAKLRQGNKLTLAFVKSRQYGPVFQHMSLKTDIFREIQVVRRADEGFRAREIRHELETRPARVEAEIKTSFYQAARNADLPADALMLMLRAFSYTVDFQRDIQPGDKIEVLYEEKVNGKGEAVRAGAVLYAALHTNGHALRIYRHETADGTVGFFNAEGESVRKALMVTPIEGARLSSGYGMRNHPILGYSRMHEGLDFAASPGTPIMAAGDGVVEYAGPRGSYGHYIRIRHPNRYKTVYAHLSRYAEDIKSGARVSQGDVIGYVGSTGRSTGPHLHYEVLYAGKSVNPSKVKTPPGHSLEGEELQRFLAARDDLEELYASLDDSEKLAQASLSGVLRPDQSEKPAKANF